MSETRNILDPLSNIVGTLTLPDGTAESEWTRLLGQYSSPPATIIPSILGTTTVSATSTATTSSGTTSIIPGMTLMTASGKYIALFNGNIYTSGASSKGEFAIYVDGVIVTETKRAISCNLTLLGGLVTVSLNEIGVGTYTGTELNLTDNQVVTVQFRSTNGGTIGFAERVFTLMKVG